LTLALDLRPWVFPRAGFLKETQMRTTPVLSGLGASLLLAAAVHAQPMPAASDPAPPGSKTFAAETFIGRRTPGVLRASDFVGREVYGPNNEAIGEVGDVLFGPDGRISGLVIEVGGTFGLDERDVAVPIHAFRIDPGATATTGTIGGLPPSTLAGAETRQDNRMSPVVFPDRIILPIPLETLRSAPAFEDSMRRPPEP
jgi:sporulation protein YlmC with PRC-barrel domain